MCNQNHTSPRQNLKEPIKLNQSYSRSVNVKQCLSQKKQPNTDV